MIRRTVGFVLTIITSVVAMNYYDWHRKSFHQLGDHPAKSLVLLALVIAAAALLVTAMIRHNPVMTLVAFGLGVVTALYGHSVLKGISWQSIALIVGTILVLVILWAITVLNAVPAWAQRFYNGSSWNFGRLSWTRP